MKRLLVALLALVLLGGGLCGLSLAILVVTPSPPAQQGQQAGISDFAHQDIPPAALAAYQAAARLCPGLSWTVLAAIGKVESDHGRSNLPGVQSGQNSAGAMGPMQFLAATWAAFGQGNIYNPVDAAAAAARYLCSNGAGDATRLRDAIWHYNHAWWYVDQVLALAARYTAAAVSGVAAAGNPFVGCAHPVVTQGYGPTSLLGEPLIGGVHFHTGIDLACPAGTPVRTLTDGIAHVTLGWGGGFGNNVVVEGTFGLPGLPVGHYFVRYAHLLDGSVSVRDGQQLRAGDQFGREGSTGYSTGPHLHFEVDLNAASAYNSVNPAPLLAA